MKKVGKKQKYLYAVGRRKEAVARVRLFSGKGQTLVNNQPIEEYFSSTVAKFFYQKPLEIIERVNKYYATIRVTGSGKVSQLAAVVHGLARALNKDSPSEYHSKLKKAGLLTRDSRVRERRKVGTGGKARRAKQSPKR